MKYQNRFFSIAALVLYVAHVIGGQSAHQLQHLTSNSACCEQPVAASAATTCSAGDNHHHSPVHAAKVVELDFSRVSNSFLSESVPSGDEEDHGTAECWTCYVLSQAAQASFNVEVVGSEAATFPAPRTTLGLSLAPVLGPVQTRGPPAFLL